MSSPSKKRRLNDGKKKSTDAEATGKALSAATEAELSSWQGFCEIDSDPAYFSVMLEEFGVKDIRVREVFSLEEEMLAFIPRPIYGLIFLFKYRADDATKQEASCPDHVWFANQTHDQACATVSLLNIVNNIQDADLGEPLKQFKDYTKDFTPALRGDAIGGFEFVKNVHNSFARKMDMLNSDLALQNRYDDRSKRPKKVASPQEKPGGSQKGRRKKEAQVTEDDFLDQDSAFHFIAFVPIGDEVWKMDGLERQPVKLGVLPSSSKDNSDDWLSFIISDLSQRMEQFEVNDINFNLLACVQDPVVGLRKRLLEQIMALKAVEARLDKDKPHGWWRDASEKADDMESMIQEHNLEEGNEHVANELKDRLDRIGYDAEALLNLRQELLGERSDILASISSEHGEAALDRRKAAERRHDFGPLIHTWLRMLAEKEGVVRELVEHAASVAAAE